MIPTYIVKDLLKPYEDGYDSSSSENSTENGNFESTLNEEKIKISSQSMKRKIELLDTYSPEDFTQILAVLNYCSRSNYKHRTEMQNYFTEIDGITKQTLTRFFRIVRYVPKDGIFKSVQHKTPDGEEIDRRVADYRIKQIADTILERFKKIKTGVTVFDEESMTDFNNLDKNIKYWAENFKFSPKTKSKSNPTSPKIIDSTKPD